MRKEGIILLEGKGPAARYIRNDESSDNWVFYEKNSIKNSIGRKCVENTEFQKTLDWVIIESLKKSTVMLDFAKAMSRVAKQDVGVCDRP